MKAFVGSKIAGVLMVVLAIGFGVLGAAAQDRMSDKDVETTMNNIRQDSKKFSSIFNTAVKKSTFRKTARKNPQERWCNSSKVELMEC